MISVQWKKQMLCSSPRLLQIISAGLIALSLTTGNLFGSVPEFEGKTNVGRVNLPGSFSYSPDKNTIRVTGSGENIWGSHDAFYFLWNKTEGDLSLAAEVSWIGQGKNPHRKAGMMIRADLEEDAPYIDAVVHGDGLISMQFRKSKGDVTNEVQIPVKFPAAGLQFERTGDQFTLVALDKDGKLHPAGTVTVELKGKVYAGLIVCSHDSTVSETAVFSNVSFVNTGVIEDSKRVVESTLETIDVETGLRTIVRRAKEHFEAPNWSRDGKEFIYNSGGKIYSLSVNGGTPSQINTGFAVKCNNDHGISASGKELVVSHHGEDGKSMIYVMPLKGGEPRLVTKLGPSYWHGWSPDEKTLAYCAERNGEFDIYTIPVGGGEEKRLTTAAGLDDGPEYSPDGEYIYFNSVRTGQMKIWRMKKDGSEQTQITPNDEFGDWFAHISPDNKSMIFVSYDKSVDGHPANKNVVLRMMPVSGGEIKTAARLFGGQGTINVPSWSPDSRQAAFVSYRLVKP